MSDWVADAVLSREDPRRRAAVIKHFVAVAEVRLSPLKATYALLMKLFVTRNAALYITFRQWRH